MAMFLCVYIHNPTIGRMNHKYMNHHHRMKQDNFSFGLVDSHLSMKYNFLRYRNSHHHNMVMKVGRHYERSIRFGILNLRNKYIH